MGATTKDNKQKVGEGTTQGLSFDRVSSAGFRAPRFYCLDCLSMQTETSSSDPRQADREEAPQGLCPTCPHPPASEGLQLENPGALVVSAELAELWVGNLESEKPRLTSLNTRVLASVHAHTHTPF